MDCDELVGYLAQLIQAGAEALKGVLAYLLSAEVLAGPGGLGAAEVDELFASVDTHKSGTLTFDELVQPLVKLRERADARHQSLTSGEVWDHNKRSNNKT